MTEPANEKKALRFGNIEDIISVKKFGIEILEGKISLLYGEIAEYYALYEDRPPSKDDPYVKEMESLIEALGIEKKFIESDMASFQNELDLHKNKNAFE